MKEPKKIVEFIESLVVEINSRGKAGSQVSIDQLDNWLDIGDMELNGLLYDTLSDARYSSIFNFRVTCETIKRITVSYLLKCIQLDLDGEYTHSGYLAGIELSNWIKYWTKNRDIESQEFDVIVNNVADIYKLGDQELKVRIINGLLEHLLDEKALRLAFSHWKDDNVLCVAFNLGINPRLPIPERLPS